MNDIITHVHDNSPRYGGMTDAIVFRERKDDGPYALPATCRYCGSIHPSDLLKLLNAGDCTLELADMKYGFPHKIYLSFPNPKAGELCNQGGYSSPKPPDEAELARYSNHRVEIVNGVKSYRGDLISPAPKNAHAKFYTEHLADLPAEHFAELAGLISRRIGIQFMTGPNGLMWRPAGR